MIPRVVEAVNVEAEEAIAAIHTIFRALRAPTMARWIALDLSAAQLKALFVLADRGPLSIGQLAEALGIGIAAGGHLVDRLVQADLAVRTEDAVDRRRTLAAVSPAGEDLVTQLRQGSREPLRAWLNDLREDEFTGLLRGLRALARRAAPPQDAAS